MKISQKSHDGFIAAAKKLNLSTDLPPLPGIREDLALYLTATYMLAVIIEAGKDGDIYDITNHSKPKFESWHTAKDGYLPGSGGGFSYHGYGCDYMIAYVGARLTTNSWEECKENAETYSDLWEIVTLNVKPAPEGQ